jgi:hypothetical protein
MGAGLGAGLKKLAPGFNPSGPTPPDDVDVTSYIHDVDGTSPNLHWARKESVGA